METEPREIYVSSNGDRWLLVKDGDRLFVRHVPNPSSGGQSTQLELAAFLLANRNSPQGKNLIEIIGAEDVEAWASGDRPAAGEP